MTKNQEIVEKESITIDVTRILTGEASIRKTAKQFGLRRDDLIKRIKDTFKDDEQAISQLNFIVAINKIIFDDLALADAAKELEMDEKELDSRIVETLRGNRDKLRKYYEKTRGPIENNNERRYPNKGKKNFQKRRNYRTNKLNRRYDEGKEE